MMMEIPLSIPFGILLSLTSVLCQPLSAPENELWANFKADFGKNYSSLEEELHRQKVFLGNLRLIGEHNKLYEEGKVTFSLRLNHFGDLSNEEFKNKLSCLKKAKHLGGNVYKADKDEVLEDSVDWRTKGAVTEVKNQGNCGGCWAFSTTGALEAAHFLKTGKLVSLSEQNLLDCSSMEGNEGCNGGLMTSAFNYIKKNGGIDTEQSYPYTAADGICHFKKGNVGATIKSYNNIEHGSESDLQSAVAKIGPVSVAIDASSPEFQFYHRGIYYSSSCSSETLDHGVLAVGYGTDSNGDYWIVKNSWGTIWGDNGYILMSRNKENNCGIASMATYPIA